MSPFAVSCARNAEGDIDLQHLIVPLYTEGEVTAYCLAVPYLRQGDYPSAENYSKRSPTAL